MYTKKIITLQHLLNTIVTEKHSDDCKILTKNCEGSSHHLLQYNDRHHHPVRYCFKLIKILKSLSSATQKNPKS